MFRMFRVVSKARVILAIVVAMVVRMVGWLGRWGGQDFQVSQDGH